MAHSIRRGLPQFCVVFVKDLFWLGWGLIIGYPTILIPGLQARNKNTEQQIELSEDEISWLGSIIFLVAPLGSIIAAGLMDIIGKKRMLQFVNFPILAAWLVLYFATNLTEIYIALAALGIGGGLLEGSLILYIAETIEPKYRGICSASGSAFLIGGVGIQFIIGTWVHWKKAAAISAIIPFVAMLVACFVPETPPWLIKSNRFEDGKKSMQFLRGWVKFDEVEEEFKEIVRSVEKDVIRTKQYQENNLGLKLKPFSKRSFYVPFSLVLALIIFSNFCGLVSLGTYAVLIFTAYKVPINEYYATIFLGIAQFVGCALGMALVKLIGKRPLAFISYLRCAVCLFAVATEATLSQSETDNMFRWIPFVLLVTATIFGHCGARMLPWMIMGEVFTMDIRSKAASISSASNYILAFAANKLFLSMVATFTLNGTFWFYSAVCFVAAFVLYFALPETEGHSLENVQAIFDKSTNSNEIDSYQDSEILNSREYEKQTNYGSMLVQ